MPETPAWDAEQASRQADTRRSLGTSCRRPPERDWLLRRSCICGKAPAPPALRPCTSRSRSGDRHRHPPRRASTPAERSVLRSHAKYLGEARSGSVQHHPPRERLSRNIGQGTGASVRDPGYTNHLRDVHRELDMAVLTLSSGRLRPALSTAPKRHASGTGIPLERRPRTASARSILRPRLEPMPLFDGRECQRNRPSTGPLQ